MSATVKMNEQITGRRNGKRWPAPGDTIQVTDQEADDLEHMGIAERVKSGGKKQRKSAGEKQSESGGENAGAESEGGGENQGESGGQ